MTIGPIITAGKIVWKYRKQIYSVVSAQDRYIKGAFAGTRVSKAAQYGWRSGAATGSLVGTYFKLPDDNNLNGGLQKEPTRKQPKTSQSYQTRNRRSVRRRPECRQRFQSYSYRR